MSARKLAIAADHAGAALKAALLNELQTIAPDWEGIDLGGDGSDLTDDYPDASRAVAELMQRGGAERGLLICGSGIGVTIAALTLELMQALEGGATLAPGHFPFAFGVIGVIAAISAVFFQRLPADVGAALTKRL